MWKEVWVCAALILCMLHSTIPQFWERCRCFTVFGKSLLYYR